MPPKRTSTSEAPAMTQAAIRKLVADSVTAALEAQTWQILIISPDQEKLLSYSVTPTENNGYTGNRPLCKKCTMYHTGSWTVKCNTCNKVGHLTKNCRNKRPATGSNLLPVTVTCHACGEKGHYAN
ncbi:putative reverse transcriptase domain-containing protein [Tanacetum coccineum]|uniref:Reverse transcriptase domain-containing protein n=1 Tax=Tanacetum coccineum TaxID=301880 RepID=A0ABQ4WIE9_9ASTR